MNQFVFTSRQKIFTGSLMAVGLIFLLIGLTGDHGGARVWSNILHNSVFFLGISFITLFLLCAKSLAYSGWQTVFKRMWEAYTFFIPVGLILMIIVFLGIVLGWHHLYHWADPAAVATDDLLQQKSAFLNKGWYIFGTLFVCGYWILTAFLFRKWSLKEDETGGDEPWNKTKILSGFFVPLGGLAGIIMTWLWLMSIDAHWYSTMYGWYCLASWFVAAIALTILMLIYLKSKGYFPTVTNDHFHDLGKYLFGFSIFWTYLWFSQFMLIWYANVGEETVYFNTRQDHYPVLFYGNLIINFALPFLVLMRNSTKRKYGTLIFASALVFFGHWLDYFQMIKPGVWETISHHDSDAGSHDDHSIGDATTIHLDEASAMKTSYKDETEKGNEGDGHSDETAHSGEQAGVNFGFQFPGFVEIGMMLGFLGLFLFVVFTALARAPLTPGKDPYLPESLHHHTM